MKGLLAEAQADYGFYFKIPSSWDPSNKRRLDQLSRREPLEREWLRGKPLERGTSQEQKAVRC